MHQDELKTTGPIGVFDSGYGGLTILRQMQKLLPQYDYLYLGDNARAPYGSHSFEVIYEYTLQAVEALFQMGCPLVILACNTASAKALRSIQQNDLHRLDPTRRVLGVIRPTVETVCGITQSKHVGVLATVGTVKSESYNLELRKLDPEIQVTGQACPIWVPLVENFEYDSPGADDFVEKRISEIMDKDPEIDTLILGCTHYPLLLHKIEKYVPQGVKIVSQGEFVSEKLGDYLLRHPEIEQRLSKGGQVQYLTTESADKFRESARLFMNDAELSAERISLPFTEK